MRSFSVGIVLISVMVFSLSALHPIISVHGARLPTVFISPSSRPLSPLGSTVTYDVNVSNLDPTNPIFGWGIYVETNNTVLSPTSVKLGPILSDGISEVLCINGNAQPGSIGCSIGDGPGLVHYEVYSLVGSGSAVNGTLFTINYAAMVGTTCTSCYSLVSFPSIQIPSTGIAPVLLDLTGAAISLSPSVGGSYGSVPKLPVASFTWTPLKPFTGDTVIFNASSSTTPPGTKLVNYSWALILPSVAPILGSGLSFVHFVGSADAGNWTMTLVVRNDLGVSSFGTSHTISVVSNGSPSFSISIIPTTVTVPANTLFQPPLVTLTSLYGFTGMVSLAPAVSPTGLLVTFDFPFNMTVFTLLPSGRDTTTLTPIVLPSTPPGNYSVTVVATSGLLRKTANATVIVPSPPPDFSMKANPSFVTLPSSGVGLTTIALTSLNGFSGTVSLRATVGSPYPIPVNPLTLSPGQVTLVPNSGANATLSFSNLGQALPPGYYSVNVNGTSRSASHSTFVTFDVLPPPPDFQLVLSISPGSSMVVAGTSTTIGVQLSSISYPYFNGNVTLTGQVSPTTANGPTLLFNPKQISLTYPGYPFSQLTISTTALTPPGNYSITIIGTSGTLVHTAQFQLTVLPPPVLTLNPSSGPVGTKVTVHGSGFLNPSQGPYSYPVQLEMTFDDQLVGLFYLQGSSFNFTFDVPDAQAGVVHQIHAKELYPSNLDVQASFLVLPEPAALSISVSVGTIYFPGDTATIFAMTSINGQTTTVDRLQVIVLTPNGSNITLNTVLVTPGVYKASYAVPTTGPIGTYAVLVKAHRASSPDESGLTGFEIKPTWLQSNGRNVITATGLVGSVSALGVVALAWRKGYFTKRRGEFLAP